MAYQDQLLVVDGLLVVVVLVMVLTAAQVLDRVDMVVVVMVELQEELIPPATTRRVTELVEVVAQDLVLPLQ